MRLLRIVNVQRSGAHSQRERPEQLARAVGFEPTFPDLETGALDQAKLRPCVTEFVRIGPWGRSRTVDLLSHNQAFWPLNYRRECVKPAFGEASAGSVRCLAPECSGCLPAEAAKAGVLHPRLPSRHSTTIGCIIGHSQPTVDMVEVSNC